MVLSQLQEKMKRLRNTLPEKVDPETDEEWLEHFRKLRREGGFRTEPDYEAAIAEYQSAIEAFPTHLQAEICLTRGLSVGALYDLACRVRIAKAWLFRMQVREQHGYEGVSEAEYEELTQWYYQHQEVMNFDPLISRDTLPQYQGIPIPLSEALCMPFRQSWYAVNTVRMLRQMKAVLSQ